MDNLSHVLYFISATNGKNCNAINLCLLYVRWKKIEEMEKTCDVNKRFYCL